MYEQTIYGKSIYRCNDNSQIYLTLDAKLIPPPVFVELTSLEGKVITDNPKKRSDDLKKDLKKILEDLDRYATVN